MFARTTSLIALLALSSTALAQTAPPVPPQTAVDPSIWPAPKWPYATNPQHEARIADMLKKMSLEEKVGQVLQADIASVTPDDVRKYHLGSVLNGGNSAPDNDEFAPPEKWLALADRFYDASMDRSDGKLPIPIFWGTDAVHGHSNIVGATLFPHNIGLGAARDPDLIERIGAATALEVRATGQEWTFAPTITVPQDYRWGRAYEGYSSDPKLVASYVGRMIKGLQGEPGGESVMAGPHVIASTKHYLADGGTTDGRDQGDAQISETELRDTHGIPYVPAIEAGVETVMTSFSSWNGTKIAGHKGLVTNILKERMNFGGLVVTDWNAHGQVAGCTNASCPQALLAGIDMYMAPDSWRDLYGTLLKQVKDGTVPMTRLDDAVARILRVKLRMGLFDVGKPSARPHSGDWKMLGAPEHRAIAREAVRKSLVLLKHQGSVLPIRAGAKVLVAGDGADDIGRQSGGWTLTWQGTGLDNSRFPGATSIYKGLSDAITATGGTATLSPDGSFSAKPDVAVVVFGETPYAEFQGDRKTLQLSDELSQPFATMKKLKAAGIPVVAVMITGRPLFVNPALNTADAFVVAWLPGSEGAGLADVLVQRRDRRAPYDFTGKLPTPWPATADAKGAALYPFGYGLTIAGAAQPWKPLSEDPGVADAATQGVFLERGLPAPSWSFYVSDQPADQTRITTVPLEALGGRASVTATDHIVQEGARRFDIKSGSAMISLATQAPIDLTRETNGDVLLVTTIRRDGAIGGPVTIGQRTGPGGATVPADLIAKLPQGQWTRVGIPLKCFAGAGANMASIDEPFQLRLAGGGSLSLARVALGTDADQRISCP
ncbi:glycoside hydrolase family 3 protein [Sphingomonas japonica]|uniref:Beta-glucosidase n=1 Tax=Sphingomonas japonica TaxID=511662 RepID=A0ABX0TZU2_9SPHN|nr:glycoside hydrolase family 3 protein [Sphingomonas japonica]NIJ22879.1 beta-glucosidase [Sphingomonas japonica]